MLQKVIRSCVCYVLLGVSAGWVVLALVDWNVAKGLVAENGPVQLLQFIFLLLIALFCFSIARSYGRHYSSKLIRNSFLVFFALSFLAAMEEVSWGQTLLGFSTPEGFAGVNVQEETNIHNLDYFQRFRHWSLILFGAVGVLSVYLRWSGRATRSTVFSFFLPPLYFVWAFCSVAISGLLVEAADIFLLFRQGPFAEFVRNQAGRFSEIGEFCAAATVLSYVALKRSEIATAKSRLANDT